MIKMLYRSYISSCLPKCFLHLCGKLAYNVYLSTPSLLAICLTSLLGLILTVFRLCCIRSLLVSFSNKCIFITVSEGTPMMLPFSCIHWPYMQKLKLVWSGTSLLRLFSHYPHFGNFGRLEDDLQVLTGILSLSHCLL